MPTFIESRKRNPWKAQIRRVGHGTEVAYFPTKEDAKEWEERRNRVLIRKSKGLPVDVADLQHITVRQLAETYLKKRTVKKASAKGETYFLQNFLQYKEVAKRPLISFL